jgi:hypothetical protein
LPGIVPLLQVDRQLVAQETSCVAAGSSSGFPDKPRLFHCFSNPVRCDSSMLTRRALFPAHDRVPCTESLSPSLNACIC